MPSITAAHQWGIQTCNNPNVGYSQAYRNQRTIMELRIMIAHLLFGTLLLPADGKWKECLVHGHLQLILWIVSYAV